MFIILNYSAFKVKIKKSLFFNFIFISLISAFISQVKAQVTQELLYKLIVIHSKQSTSTNPIKSQMEEFIKSIKLIDKNEQNEKKFIGTAKFEFGGDNSNSQGQYRVDAGIEVNRGVYPSEFKFKASIGSILNDDKFTENVSNIYMSYDYNPDIKNVLSLEHFAFLSRFTDTYLGIDQRYEVGLGTILAYWSDNLTPQGENIKTKLNQTPSISNTTDFNRDYNYLPSGENEPEKLSIEDKKSLSKSYNRALSSTKKAYSKLRAGVLMGLLFELEKVTTTDSLTTDALVNGTYLKIQKKESFEPTEKLRWEIRPFFQLRGNDKYTLLFKPYLKFPMPWRWYETTLINNNGKEFKKFDFRIDFETSLSIGLTDTDNKNVAIELSYKLYFDNAPQTKFYPDLDPNKNNLQIIANDFHHMFRMSLKVDF